MSDRYIAVEAEGVKEVDRVAEAAALGTIVRTINLYLVNGDAHHYLVVEGGSAELRHVGAGSLQLNAGKNFFRTYGPSAVLWSDEQPVEDRGAQVW